LSKIKTTPHWQSKEKVIRSHRAPLVSFPFGHTISEENNFPARWYQSVRIALGAEPYSG